MSFAARSRRPWWRDGVPAVPAGTLPVDPFNFELRLPTPVPLPDETAEPLDNNPHNEIHDEQAQHDDH